MKLFRTRLDKLEAAIAAGRTDVAEQVKLNLRADLADLPKNNVVVSDKQADLAATEQEEFWKHLSAKEIGLLRSTIAPVMRARSAADFKAMRFETEVVEAGVALLADNKESFEAVKESLLVQISELPLTVNVVAKEQDLIAAPFTQIHPKGVRGVFQPAEINEILSLTKRLVA